MVEMPSFSRVDRHRFYVGIDPNLDADPDPYPDWHQRDDADPHADPTPIFTIFFIYIQSNASLQYFSFLINGKVFLTAC